MTWTRGVHPTLDLHQRYERHTVRGKKSTPINAKSETEEKEMWTSWSGRGVPIQVQSRADAQQAAGVSGLSWISGT